MGRIGPRSSGVGKRHRDVGQTARGTAASSHSRAPDTGFSATHLDCPYGKTEAWYVLGTEPGAAVYLGWKTPVDRDELDRRRDAQDSAWLLDHMNRVEVHPGMGIFVPAGTVHAIDSGIFVAEVQEPTDFSILLEWSVTTSSRDESHLGVGFETVCEPCRPSQQRRTISPLCSSILTCTRERLPRPVCFLLSQIRSFDCIRWRPRRGSGVGARRFRSDSRPGRLGKARRRGWGGELPVARRVRRSCRVRSLGGARHRPPVSCSTWRWMATQFGAGPNLV